MLHRLLMWIGVVFCAIAMGLGTVAMVRGNVEIWLLNCLLFSINAVVVVFNAQRIR